MTIGFIYFHTASDTKPITGFKERMAQELRRMAANERTWADCTTSGEKARRETVAKSYLTIASILENTIIEGE